MSRNESNTIPQILYDYSVKDAEPEERFDDVTVLAAEVGGVGAAALFLVDQTSSEQRWVVKSRHGISSLREAPAFHSVCLAAVTAREVMVVSDAFADARVTTPPGTMRFYAAAPLFSPSGQSAGALCVMDREPHEFSLEKRRSLERLGRQVMAQLELGKQRSELERVTRETSLLNEMGDLFQSCLTMEEAFLVINRSARRLFPTESGALCIQNPTKGMVEAVAFWGETTSCEPVFAAEECWALRRGRVHIAEEPSAGLLCRHVSQVPWTSYLCIPMMAQGETLGVLNLQAGRPGERLTAAQQQLAITVAEQAGLALANLKLRETLRSQSMRDPLTGLYNRRYMDEMLERELYRVQRKQSSLSLIMLDLDHFKQFNDRLGHAAGDTLLRALGGLLTTRVRREDIPCRYGGEEFVVILPEATLEIAQRRAEMLREEVRQLSLEGEAHGPITLSLGVSSYPQHGRNVAVLLRVADQALYRAKNEGRDRVVVGDASELEPGDVAS